MKVKTKTSLLTHLSVWVNQGKNLELFYTMALPMVVQEMLRLPNKISKQKT